ncbi:class I SAM-dependent methyltransferase [Dokdonella sp.]|uniref:class I SAM-dependent methyltransferase n=1 Tax=Dokdonella sp. TaxID=2291710 RepID=UPI003C469E5A
MALSAATSVAALDALHHVLGGNLIDWPADGRVLFLRARDGHWWYGHSRKEWVCQQGFKPFATALERSGLQVRDPATDEKFPLVLVLPPRQRDEARALFARALQHCLPGGTVVASMANSEGARSGEADFRKLVGSAQVISKHHCRVFWSTPAENDIDTRLLEEWLALDAPRVVADGRYLSRPGLFAWNRIDPASALLVSQLPHTLSGRVADLGSGYGYLAGEVLRNCAGVTAIDLYEAEARAIEPARRNMEAVRLERRSDVDIDVHWHDVTQGLPRRYDVIVSNPPFHQGRADQPELGQAFIAVAANALNPSGRLWIVANRHLPYEASLRSRFANVETRVLKSGFKVFEASGVRA